MEEEKTTPGSEQSQARFHWTFQGRIMVVDNGAGFVNGKGFSRFMSLNSFAVVSFDPANITPDPDTLEAYEHVQRVPDATLGCGEPVIRHECLEPSLTATLEPLPDTLAEHTPNQNLDMNPVLARIPIGSVRLDDIEGLDTVDWLVLDSLNDNLAIMEHGRQRLADTLLVQVEIPFRSTHKGQASFAAVDTYMHDIGFRFYCFQNYSLKSHLPSDRYLEKKQSSDMVRASALYVPTPARLQQLSANRLLKLGFVLHTVYKLQDMAYHVLSLADAQQAQQYLSAEGFVWPVDEDETDFVLTETYSPDIWNRQPAG